MEQTTETTEQTIKVKLVENPTPSAIQRGIVDRWTVMGSGEHGWIGLCTINHPVVTELGLKAPEQMTRVTIELSASDVETIRKGRVPDALGVQIEDRLHEQELAKVQETDPSDPSDLDDF